MTIRQRWGVAWRTVRLASHEAHSGLYDLVSVAAKGSGLKHGKPRGRRCPLRVRDWWGHFIDIEPWRRREVIETAKRDLGATRRARGTWGALP